MRISNYLILSTLMLAVACQDYFSESYIKQSANDKMNKLWADISKDQTSFGFYSTLEITGIFISDLTQSFTVKGDLLPSSRKKLIHTTGVIATAYWISTNDHPYTGVFQGSTSFLVRYSIAKKADTTKKSAAEALANFAPGISLKFLRDGVDSANLVAMFSTGGQASWNPFKNDFTNSFAIGSPGIAEKVLATKFSSVTSWISSVGVRDMATFGQDGKKVATPRFPFRLIFRPTAQVNTRFPETYTEYFTEQLAKITPQTSIYDVYAIDQPGCPEAKIATVQITSNFVKSKFGDEKLFFRHGLIDDDDKGTNWAQYRDSFSFFGGVSDAKVTAKKSGCPFAKLY